jgi:hypothetical protein
MTALTITIEPDEFSGLFALVQISNAADNEAPADADLDSEVVSRAKTLMRHALADELQQAGLPWAPDPAAGHSWTGFRDQKLWNWIDLLVLPAALAITAALTGRGIRSRGRLLRPYERGIVAALAAGWIVTVIGGYALRWTWTGYHGNTLWDWLSMLLVPLVFPTILLPALLKWTSGNAAQRASQAHQTPAGPPAAAAGG